VEQKKYDVKNLIRKIKQKKELSDLADSVVKSSLENYLNKYKISINESNPARLKIILKEVRAELRKLSGQYQKTIKDKSKFSTQELLKSHSSTAERFDFYPELKNIFFDLKVKSVLDLGCGLNPIALANQSLTYYASDIKENELKIIKKFFKKNKINGTTFVYDLRSQIGSLPEVDICLIFKVLDIIDDKGHKTTEEILKKISCKYFLISFSTKKLSGKPMNHPTRFWFESILKRLNLKFKKFKSTNEIFYLIEN